MPAPKTKKTANPKSKMYRQPYVRKPRTELKAVDDTTTLATITNNAATSAVVLNDTIQGSAFYQRVGNKITMKNLQFDLKLIPSANANAVSDWIRVLVFYDKQTNATAPVRSAVLLDTEAGGATSTTSMSGINMINRDRFKVLVDEKLWVPPTTASGANSNHSPDSVSKTFCVKRFVSLRNLETVYNQVGGGGVGDITSGGLFYIVMCQNANCGYGFDCKTRLRYTDY